MPSLRRLERVGYRLKRLKQAWAGKWTAPGGMRMFGVTVLKYSDYLPRLEILPWSVRTCGQFSIVHVT